MFPRQLGQNSGHGFPTKAKVIRNVRLPKPQPKVIALDGAFSDVEQEGRHPFLCRVVPQQYGVLLGTL